jgi:hypothetical protein
MKTIQLLVHGTFSKQYIESLSVLMVCVSGIRAAPSHNNIDIVLLRLSLFYLGIYIAK